MGSLLDTVVDSYPEAAHVHCLKVLLLPCVQVCQRTSSGSQRNTGKKHDRRAKEKDDHWVSILCPGQQTRSYRLGQWHTAATSCFLSTSVRWFVDLIYDWKLVKAVRRKQPIKNSFKYRCIVKRIIKAQKGWDIKVHETLILGKGRLIMEIKSDFLFPEKYSIKNGGKNSSEIYNILRCIFRKYVGVQFTFLKTYAPAVCVQNTHITE